MKVTTQDPSRTVFVETESNQQRADNNYRIALEFADKAKVVADDILGSEYAVHGQPREHIGKVKVYHYHDYGWGWWGYNPSVYIIDGRSSYRRSDDDGSARFLLGLLAAVVGGFALYHLGTAIKHFREAEEELREIRPFTYWSIVAGSKENSNLPFCKTIEKIAKLESKIFTRIKHQAGWKLAETAGITAGCALTLVGAIYAVQVYVASGIVLGCVFTGSMLFRWGMDSMEKDHRRDAQAIRTALVDLL
jgi:hypothetical protein